MALDDTRKAELGFPAPGVIISFAPRPEATWARRFGVKLLAAFHPRSLLFADRGFNFSMEELRKRARLLFSFCRPSKFRCALCRDKLRPRVLLREAQLAPRDYVSLTRHFLPTGQDESLTRSLTAHTVTGLHRYLGRQTREFVASFEDIAADRMQHAHGGIPINGLSFSLATNRTLRHAEESERTARNLQVRRLTACGVVAAKGPSQIGRYLGVTSIPVRELTEAP